MLNSYLIIATVIAILYTCYFHFVKGGVARQQRDPKTNKEIYLPTGIIIFIYTLVFVASGLLFPLTIISVITKEIKEK